MKPIISPNVRIRHPEFFDVGDFSIIDDFCYFSTKVRVGKGSHIASGCTVAGGVEWEFALGDFSSLSSGVKIWCTSDDFVNDIVTIVPVEAGAIKNNLISGNVVLENYTAVGSNSVVMPNNCIPIGTSIGALSFVPAQFCFKPWSVYAGVPIRFIRPRNRDNILVQIEKLHAFLAGSHD